MTEIGQSRDAIKEEKLDGGKVAGYFSPVRKLEKHDVSSSVFLRSRITRAKSFRNYLSSALARQKEENAHGGELQRGLVSGRRTEGGRRDGVRGTGEGGGE